MVDRIDRSDFSMQVEQARSRQTPENDFGSMVSRGAEKVAGVVVEGARIAAPVIPGAGFITAVADIASEVTGDALGGGKGANLLRAQERLQEEGFTNSLRLLNLQRRMHQETEAFSAVSNMMKNRHEMAKRAINNIN